MSVLMKTKAADDRLPGFALLVIRRLVLAMSRC